MKCAKIQILLIAGVLCSFLSSFVLANVVQQHWVVSRSHPKVKIHVAENGGTGYMWYLVEYDHRLMNKPTYTTIVPKKLMPGAPVDMVWEFDFKPSAFKVSTETEVVLEYKRAWEKSVAETRIITIKMNKK